MISKKIGETPTEMRWGHLRRIDLDDVSPSFTDANLDDVIALDAALQSLAKHDDRQCKVVECRFFAGMTIKETAEVVGVAPITVTRDWDMARAWLYRRMCDDRNASSAA